MAVAYARNPLGLPSACGSLVSRAVLIYGSLSASGGSIEEGQAVHEDAPYSEPDAQEEPGRDECGAALPLDLRRPYATQAAQHRPRFCGVSAEERDGLAVSTDSEGRPYAALQSPLSR